MTNQRTVLVVDDDPDCVRAVQLLLQDCDQDLRILKAGNSKEALAILENEEVSSLLTDHRMPGMTGLELLARVKKERPTVGRLLMTAYPDFEVALRAINEVGVQCFLRKPLDPDVVCDHVQRSIATA